MKRETFNKIGEWTFVIVLFAAIYFALIFGS
jgi:hypothetical protein